MNAVKRLRIAESLDFFAISHNKTKMMLQKILEDPKYIENAKRLSVIVNDQKEKPLERAVWWIEWILRNPHLDSLKSPVNSLGYIVGNSLDIISFATIFFILQMFLLYKLACSVFSLLSGRNKFKLTEYSNKITNCKKLK